MTLVPKFLNSPWTNSLADVPIETIAVTAAIPITTPRMVSPARILFLLKAAIAMRNVFKIDTRNSGVHTSLLMISETWGVTTLTTYVSTESSVQSNPILGPTRNPSGNSTVEQLIKQSHY